MNTPTPSCNLTCRAPRIALASLALLAAPLAAHARQQAAMDACIKAFVTAHFPKEQPVTVRKLDTTTSPASVLASRYRITVTARGAQSGKSLAKGTCIADRAGTVLSMNGVPVAPRADATTLAAAGDNTR
jgi:hypothetical protein